MLACLIADVRGVVIASGASSDQRQGFLVSAHRASDDRDRRLRSAGRTAAGPIEPPSRRPGGSSAPSRSARSCLPSAPRLCAGPAARPRADGRPAAARRRRPPPPPRTRRTGSASARRSDARQREPLILRRDEDLTAVAEGRPDAPGHARDPAPPRPSRAGARRADGRGAADCRAPPAGRAGARRRRPTRRRAPSIAVSLRNLEQRLADAGAAGVGRGHRPADGAAVLRSARAPTSPPGSTTSRTRSTGTGSCRRRRSSGSARARRLRVHAWSGTGALERPAHAQVLGHARPSTARRRTPCWAAACCPLPADYGPPRVTMQVTFFYNEGPQGS